MFLFHLPVIAKFIASIGETVTKTYNSRKSFIYQKLKIYLDRFLPG